MGGVAPFEWVDSETIDALVHRAFLNTCLASRYPPVDQVMVSSSAHHHKGESYQKLAWLTE